MLCDTGAVTSVAPRNFAGYVPQPHYAQLALSTVTNQPIHIYGYKHILLVCNNISFTVRFYICETVPSKLQSWDFTTSLTAKSSSTSMVRTALPSNIMVRQNLYTIIEATSSLMRWPSTSITRYISIGCLHSTTWF